MRVLRRNYADYSPLTVTLLTIINVAFGIIETLIGLRIVLELLGANRSSGFVQYIYGLSAPFVAPFIGVFPDRFFSDGFFLDAAAILAFIVYAIIWAIISSLIARAGFGETEE